MVDAKSYRHTILTKHTVSFFSSHQIRIAHVISYRCTWNTCTIVTQHIIMRDLKFLISFPKRISNFILHFNTWIWLKWLYYARSMFIQLIWLYLLCYVLVMWWWFPWLRIQREYSRALNVIMCRIPRCVEVSLKSRLLSFFVQYEIKRLCRFSPCRRVHYGGICCKSSKST